MLYPEGLYSQLCSKRTADPSQSWTAQLMQQGVTGIAKKISEEATELALAAREFEQAQSSGMTNEQQKQLQAHVTYEAADLLYHYLVLLAHIGISPDDICNELAERTHTSGIAEKRARK